MALPTTKTGLSTLVNKVKVTPPQACSEAPLPGALVCQFDNLFIYQSTFVVVEHAYKLPDTQRIVLTTHGYSAIAMVRYPDKIQTGEESWFWEGTVHQERPGKENPRPAAGWEPGS